MEYFKGGRCHCRDDRCESRGSWLDPIGATIWLVIDASRSPFFETWAAQLMLVGRDHWPSVYSFCFFASCYKVLVRFGLQEKKKRGGFLPGSGKAQLAGPVASYWLKKALVPRMQMHDGRFLMQDRLGVWVIVWGACFFLRTCMREKKGKETRCNATPCKIASTQDAAVFVSGHL